MDTVPRGKIKVALYFIRFRLWTQARVWPLK